MTFLDLYMMRASARLAEGFRVVGGRVAGPLPRFHSPTRSENAPAGASAPLAPKGSAFGRGVRRKTTERAVAG